MRKSTLFISAVLTTFMLVILVGVVSAFRSTNATTQTNSQPATEVAVVNTETAVPSPTVRAILTPEQAAALAAQVIGRIDLYSVETTTFNNVSAYLVTFTSGDLVYVSPEGMILSITKLPPVASAPAGSATGNNGGGHHGNGGGGGGGGGDDGGGGVGDDGGGGDD